MFWFFLCKSATCGVNYTEIFFGMPTAHVLTGFFCPLNLQEDEEWDRHLAHHPVLDEGRMLGLCTDEKLFEKEINDPWDKHEADGLVWYTGK